MTPAYIAEKLSMLPRFTVESIDREPGHLRFGMSLTGAVSHDPGPWERCMCLYWSNLDFFDGMMKAVGADARRRIVEGAPASTEQKSVVAVGQELAMFPYDLRRLKLVIDPDLAWQRIDFTPTKALFERVTGTNGEALRRWTEYHDGDPVPEGAWIEEGAWDHEHCVFCSGKIDEENEGYMCDAEGVKEWVCADCYRDAVVPHDPTAL